MMSRGKSCSGKILPNHKWGKDCFIWKIDDFFSHPRSIHSPQIVSPNFTALGAEWWFEICPSVYIRGVPHAQLQLSKKVNTPTCKVTYKFSIRGRPGSEAIMCSSGEKTFTINDNVVQKTEAPSLWQRSERELWAPDGNVCVFLRLQECRATSSQLKSPLFCFWNDDGDEQVESKLPFFLRSQIDVKAQYRVLGQDIHLQTQEEKEIDSNDKSLHFSDRYVGVQTDDGDEHSEDCKVGKYKSGHGAVFGKDIGVQTDDFNEHSENCKVGQSKSCHPTGTWQARISQLYDTKDYTNVRFVVNERVFEAHRFVLWTRSPKFCGLLTGANAALDTHIIDDENVTETGFDILLRFLYKDTLETNDKRSIVEAYYSALTYQVQDLQDKCEEEMNAWEITQDEVWTLLDCGMDVPALRNMCTDLLRRDGAAALSSPDFQQISFKTLRFVLNNGVLENVPTIQRIERIMEWCIQPNPEETNYAGARNKLLGDGANPLLGRLEIQNLELKDLSHVVGKYRGLITPEELVSFLQYNHTRDASVLPDWCLAVSCE